MNARTLSRPALVKLNRELNGQIKKHQEDMRVLAEMEQATKEKDEENKGEPGFETGGMRGETQRLEREATRLVSDYRREKSEFQAHLAELERRCDTDERLCDRPPPTMSTAPLQPRLESSLTFRGREEFRGRTICERSGAIWYTIVLPGFGG